MRNGLLFLLVGLMAMTTSPGTAQSTPHSVDFGRKVVWRAPPRYPELAKKMNIRGMVRVEAVVRPNGSVKSTRVLGGNPVLVDAALDAVGKWRFESAQGD